MLTENKASSGFFLALVASYLKVGMPVGVPFVEAVASSPLLSFAYLEDVARLGRVSVQLRDLLKDLGAGSAARRSTRSRNVSRQHRVRWWSSVLQVEEARRAMLKREASTGTNAGMFERCAGLYDGRRSAKGGLERLSSTGIQGEIRRDIGRTFATREFFAAAQGQDLLADILVALAVAHPQIGYCQGMNLVAGALLEVHVREGDLPAEAEIRDSEELTKKIVDSSSGGKKCWSAPLKARKAQRAVFWLVSALCQPAPRQSARMPPSSPKTPLDVIDRQPGAPPRLVRGQSSSGSLSASQPKYGRQVFDNWLELKELWQPGMPQLKLRVFQFDRLLGRFMPRLRAHFKDIGLAPDVLGSQWFFTLFAYVLPAHWLPRVWDVVFADGWKAVMRIALGRLALAADDLLSFGLEEAGKYMRDRSRLTLRASERGVETLIEAGFRFKVTRTALAELTEMFGVALLEERCREPADMTEVQLSAEASQESWLRRYGGQGDDLLADAPARALRSRLAEMDETTKKDAFALRARIERIERDGADAAIRLEKATATLREKRRNVGELVDVKRKAAARAARLVLALSDDEDEDQEDDDVPAPASASGSSSIWRRIGSSSGDRRGRPKPMVPFAASCLSLDDDKGVVRDELRVTQTRAAKAEKELRVAREKLSIAARDFVVAQADLDESRERKEAAELQLMHIVANASERRRGVLAEVVQSGDTPDLNLVKRFSEPVKRHHSDQAVSSRKPYDVSTAFSGSTPTLKSTQARGGRVSPPQHNRRTQSNQV